MVEPALQPDIIISPSASDEQRLALAGFMVLAKTTEPDVVEAALRIQSEAPNLMPLVERVVRQEVSAIYDAWRGVVATLAYTAIEGFDPDTEASIDADEEHSRLLAKRDEIVVQSSSSRSLIRPNKPSGYLNTVQSREEAIRLELIRRKLSIFAGRLATTDSQELAEPA